mgnify:CR=1 FL=1
MEYTVAPGDTLTSIAAANPGTTPQSIAEANGITNINDIKVDQVLTIPDVVPEAVIPGEEPGVVPSDVDDEMLIEKVMEETVERDLSQEGYGSGTGKFTGPGIDVSLEGEGDLDTSERDFFGDIVTETGEGTGTYSVDITKGDEEPISEAAQFAEGGVTEGGVALEPTQKEVEVTPVITGDEEPVAEASIDGPPVEEVDEEPGELPDLEEQSKESAIQVAESVGIGLKPDTKTVYDDVIKSIDDMDITPTEGVEEYYNKLAENINDRIEDYNIAISNIAEEKQKPTFEGWDKFLAVLGAALGAYGSAMTGTPNFALNIVNDAIDRDTQAFLKSKEIRTKALSEQRMDLLMRRGELLQLAQNRVTALMQSKSFELARQEARANIQGIFDGLEQSKETTFINYKLAVAQMAKDFYVADATLKASLNKEQRRRMVNSWTAVDSKGNAVAVPAYLARDVDSAKKLTTEQSAAMDALGYLEEIDQLYESNEKYIPAWLGGTVSQKIDRIANKLELTFKKIEGMGANYTMYEAALIRGILPTSSLIDKISKYKVKSAMLRDQLINKIKNNARVRGAAPDSPMPTNKRNIEKFGGTKGVSG